MSFKIQSGDFLLHDKKIFLNSGEIHYFRIRRELWETHLQAAREAGLMAVSTYVPWAWHEAEEGVFDFTGATCPEKDLESWTRLCQEAGLYCILKPGPFILAEFRGAGLPDWFMEQFREQVKMKTRNGAVVGGDGVSLFNDIYLEKVSLWYEAVMPFIAERQVNRGGPVIMMQVCNEIGVFSWLARQADYGNKVRERFIRWLKEKYAGVALLNTTWGTDFQDFDFVEMPPDGPVAYISKQDRARDYDWHCFWRRYYGDYLRLLTGKVRSHGIELPLYHNLPGWIYGSGYEFPVNITMYDDLFGEKSELIFGVDHIPEFLSHRNLHDDRIINDITYAMQEPVPLFAAEFQSGSREYHVVTNPREMELFYKASIANGLKGWNYYMFSQGRNPARKGYSGDTFYWFNPLTAEGERTSAFPLISRMSRILGVLEPVIVNAVRRSEICVLFYPPYYATELERPVSAACGLTWVASAIRRSAYFDGLLKALQVLNMDYDMVDLSGAGADRLSGYKQVWVFATEEMNAREQQTLVDVIQMGGHCVIFPALPDRDQWQQPCTILRDAVAMEPTGKEVIDSPLIDVYQHKDIKCANPQMIFDTEGFNDVEVIARTLSGKACGFRRKVGMGSVTHLGTWIGFDTEGHKPVYRTLAGHSGARLTMAGSTNDFITVRERLTKTGEALLFVGNYYNEEQQGQVYYHHPVTGEKVSLPFLGQQMVMPPLYGFLTPVNLVVAEGLSILHTTSDIIDIQFSDGKVEVTLFGDRDMAGEMVFEGEQVKRIKSVTVLGMEMERVFSRSRLVVQYPHPREVQFIMEIRL